MEYRAELDINPNNHTLKCTLNLSFEVKENMKKVKLLLYRNMIINSVEAEGLVTYHFEEKIAKDSPFVLEVRRLILTFNQELKSSDKCSITFNYSGIIDHVTNWGINRVDEDFVELGLYTPWFPLFKDLPEATFNLTITIPDDYTLINGYNIEKEHHTWNLNQSTPSNDCAFLAMRDIKEYGNSQFKVYYQDASQATIALNLFHTTKLVYDYYVNLIGEIKQEKYLSIALPRRNKGGGYVRNGLMVLTIDRDEMKRHLRFIGHELSHLWWNKGDQNTWEDWLNESFAEYSALMVIRELDSMDAFEDKIREYEINSEGLPAIKHIKRDDEQAYSVFYKKGPVYLYKLEQQIGMKVFMELFRLKHEKKVSTTEQFLLLLTDLAGAEVSKQFEQMLAS